MYKLLLLGSTLFLLSSCGHHRDVRPGTEEVHSVIIEARSVPQASKQALAQANHFCKHIGKHYAAVLKEDSKYVGDLAEEDYKIGKKVSDVAGILLPPGGHRGKYAADQVLGNGYEVNIQFKCL